jgi:ankyrin repeat protein
MSDKKKISVETFVQTKRVKSKEPATHTAMSPFRGSFYMGDPGDRDTALACASKNGHLETVKLLLDQGANVNSKDRFGNFALVLATSGRYIEIVRLLLDQGANVDSKDNEGDPVLQIASKNGYTEIVRLLLDRGANIDLKDDSYNFTALMYASIKGRTEIVQLLLNWGADTSLKNTNGKTALCIASFHDHNKIVALLSSSIEDKLYYRCMKQVAISNADTSMLSPEMRYTLKANFG